METRGIFRRIEWARSRGIATPAFWIGDRPQACGHDSAPRISRQTVGISSKSEHCPEMKFESLRAAIGLLKEIEHFLRVGSFLLGGLESLPKFLGRSCLGGQLCLQLTMVRVRCFHALL